MWNARAQERLDDRVHSLRSKRWKAADLFVKFYLLTPVFLTQWFVTLLLKNVISRQHPLAKSA